MPITWLAPGLLSEQGGGAEFSNSKTLGIGTIENLRLECVLNESAMFAINAHTQLSLNCSKTVTPRQVKFHLGVEFTTHFGGNS
jgi:hypothetical protein